MQRLVAARPRRRRLMRNPVSYILFASILLGLLGLIIFKQLEVSASFDDPALPAYCGARPRGMEGVLHHPRPGLALHAVVLTIRHGDRSAIHELPSTNETARWACRPAGLDQRRAAAAARVVGTDGRLLHRSLLPQTDDGAGGHCASGQLTPRGFAQHAALGRHLGRAFAPLLRSIWSERAPRNDRNDRNDHNAAAPEQHGVATGAEQHAEASPGPNASASHGRLYVRSTDYTRTLMSAAALLSGMLGSLSMRPTAERPVTIHTQASTAAAP